MNIWYTFVTLAVIVAIVGLIIQHFALKGLEYTRTFSKSTYFEGEAASMVEVVRNDRPFLVPWLRVESRLPASFHFGHQENLQISGNMYHRSVFMLMPYQQITRRHHVRMMHRGTYNVGNATLTAGDLFGTMQAHQQIQLSIPVLVYPRLLNENELPPRFAQLIGDCIVQRSLLTDPFLISGIRSYQYGDNIRDIHWPASARTQELQVRTHDFTAQTRLLVLMNCQTREDQWDGEMDDYQPVIERQISLAATMCISILRAGLTAGFGTNMPTDDTRNNTLLLPSGGAAREEELLSTMAHLRMRMSRSFISFLQQLRDLKDLDIVIISAYDNEPIREQMHILQAQGNTVRLYLTDKEEATYAE